MNSPTNKTKLDEILEKLHLDTCSQGCTVGSIFEQNEEAKAAIKALVLEMIGEEWHHNSEKWCAGANTRREHILKQLEEL